jgi:hypothetical protein
VSDSEVTRIRIKNYQVGLVGLKKILADMAAEFAGQPDEVCREELLRRVSTRNYIPDTAREDYGRVLLRELYSFLGRPVPEEASGGLRVTVLGPGCAVCDRLEQEVLVVLSELKLPADYEHVTDIKEIGRSGVLGTPALKINDRVVSVGRVPPHSAIRKWLEEATQKT